MKGAQIAALVIGLTVAAVFFVPLVDTINENTGEIEVNNESFNATLGEAQDLSGFNIVDGTETVEYDPGTGYEAATEGTDYSIDNDAGTVTPLSSGAISEGDDVRVSYTYASTDGTTTVVAGVIPVLVALLLLVPMARKVQEAV